MVQLGPIRSYFRQSETIDKMETKHRKELEKRVCERFSIYWVLPIYQLVPNFFPRKAPSRDIYGIK